MLILFNYKLKNSNNSFKIDYFISSQYSIMDKPVEKDKLKHHEAPSSADNNKQKHLAESHAENKKKTQKIETNANTLVRNG